MSIQGVLKFAVMTLVALFVLSFIPGSKVSRPFM